VLIVRRIHVAYHLRVASNKQEAARRAHERHVAHCPMTRTIGDCVKVTTSLEMENLFEAA
jgi:uncharacterized OsmC-like protein